ncbi:MAG: hypothetical protein IJU37_07805 [Desulfovibrio sp.]|nr:hypothetical protein [Desulfovibrio sp.]
MPPQKLQIHKYVNLPLQDNRKLVADFIDFWLKNGAMLGERYYFRSTAIDGLIFYTEEERHKWVGNRNPFVKQDRIKFLSNNPSHLLAEIIDELGNALRKDIKSKSIILEQCSNGFQPIIKLSDWLKLAVEKNVLTCSHDPNDDDWIYRIVVTEQLENTSNLTFEEYITLKWLFLPLLTPNAEIKLKYTKKCACCGDFYQAKGDKAIYCSERCRSRMRAKLQKKDGDV